MNIALCYYSSTGNTQLACRYVARKINNAQFDLMDSVKSGPIDLSPYEVVGFATSTFYMGVPYPFSDFIEGAAAVAR